MNSKRRSGRVEKMPWVKGKHRLTEAYAWFLADWAKRLSWQEVAVAFRTTWDHVFCSVERAVVWGREQQDLSGIEAIGVDEIAWQRGHRYLTLVYQIDGHCKRVLWIGEKRTVKTLVRFFRWFGKERSQALENCFLARNQFSNSGRCRLSIRATFFIGSIFERMVLVHHLSRNCPAQ